MNDGKTWVWVMPSSSARVAQLPRAADKVPFFEALRKFRDYLNGKIDNIQECEVTFASVVLKNWPKANSIKVEKLEEECVDNNIINGNNMCLESNIICEINTNITVDKANLIYRQYKKRLAIKLFCDNNHGSSKI